MYDVFLSHNRRDKPWVRSLYAFLTAKGLKVFFDEESIGPGEPIVEAIGKALDDSKHVILVLSPGSVLSRWVALEMQIAVMEDPAGSNQVLLPLLVAKLPIKNVPPAIRILKYMDLTSPETREANLAAVFKKLGCEATADELKQLCATVNLKSPLVPLDVEGCDEVVGWGWSGADLLNALIALDYQTLLGLTAEDEGTVDQWAPIFMGHPQTWRVLTKGPGEICGYWHFATLFPDDFARAKAGQLSDSDITMARMQPFAKRGTYNIYFVQVCLHPRYREPSHLLRLFGSVRTVLEDLQANGISIGEVCANAYSDEGHAMCRLFNMTEVIQHKHHGTIYSAPMVDVMKSLADA